MPRRVGRKPVGPEGVLGLNAGLVVGKRRGPREGSPRGGGWRGDSGKLSQGGAPGSRKRGGQGGTVLRAGGLGGCGPWRGWDGLGPGRTGAAGMDRRRRRAGVGRTRPVLGWAYERQGRAESENVGGKERGRGGFRGSKDFCSLAAGRYWLLALNFSGVASAGGTATPRESLVRIIAGRAPPARLGPLPVQSRPARPAYARLPAVRDPGECRRACSPRR